MDAEARAAEAKKVRNQQMMAEVEATNRVALKKMPNVFQNIVSSKRVYRELRMLSFFKHDNVSFLHIKTVQRSHLYHIVVFMR